LISLGLSNMDPSQIWLVNDLTIFFLLCFLMWHISWIHNRCLPQVMNWIWLWCDLLLMLFALTVKPRTLVGATFLKFLAGSFYCSLLIIDFTHFFLQLGRETGSLELNKMRNAKCYKKYSIRLLWFYEGFL